VQAAVEAVVYASAMTPLHITCKDLVSKAVLPALVWHLQQIPSLCYQQAVAYAATRCTRCKAAHLYFDLYPACKQG
jgi:hypothetical protein